MEDERNAPRRRVDVHSILRLMFVPLQLGIAGNVGYCYVTVAILPVTASWSGTHDITSNFILFSTLHCMILLITVPTFTLFSPLPVLSLLSFILPQVAIYLITHKKKNLWARRLTSYFLILPRLGRYFILVSYFSSTRQHKLSMRQNKLVWGG